MQRVLWNWFSSVSKMLGKRQGENRWYMDKKEPTIICSLRSTQPEQSPIILLERMCNHRNWSIEINNFLPFYDLNITTPAFLVVESETFLNSWFQGRRRL